MLKENLAQIHENKYNFDDLYFKAEKISHIITEIEDFLIRFNNFSRMSKNQWGYSENQWDYYVQAIELFLKVSADLSANAVLVIERVRELRKWQKALTSEGKIWNSESDDGSEKFFYETYLRDKVSEEPKMSYIILDVSPDVSIDIRTKSRFPEKNCKVIKLHPLSKGSIRIWLHEFLEKEHHFEIQDSFECLNAIDSAFDGHTGHIHSLLSIQLKRKNTST